MVSELVSQRPYATEAGTARFAARHGGLHAPDAFSAIGKMLLSSVGLGTYTGPATDQADDQYVEAVTDAVRRGINVVDTASNYRHQRSERAIGRALQGLFERGEIFRSEILVSSKAGFVPFDGEQPCDPHAFLRGQTIDAGLCDPDELVAGCHCLAPEFILRTLAQSRANLGLQTIDVYLLHNPDTQLQTCDRDTVHERLRRAFAALEGAADQGHIRVYGLATWSGLRARHHERDFLSLFDVVRIAEQVAGPRHRFKAVQLPINLAMPEAHTRKNHHHGGQEWSALQAAHRLGLAVFASSALNSGRLGRAAPGHVPPLPPGHGCSEAYEPSIAALQFARSVPGVHTALVGMRSLPNVATNARVLRVPRAPEPWLPLAAQPLRSGAWTAIR